MTRLRLRCALLVSPLLCACSGGPIIEYSGDSFSNDTGSEGSESSTDPSTGEEEDSDSASGGDGDGDGDAPTSGDGDGDAPTSGDGDGDGDATTSGDGDGDGDPPPMPECGNGVWEGPDEECDGDDFAGFDCYTFDFDGGVLSCNESCQIDTSECTYDPCGNGILELDEACDLQEFGDETCISQGEGPGALLCTDVCTIDASECGIPGEGDSCNPLLFDFCPDPNLYCAGGDCWDGSVGDECLSDEQCLSGDCDGEFGLFTGNCT